MLTLEEIKKIAREYAESVNPNAPYDTLSDNKKKSRDMCVREVYIPLLEWLSKDYCIVPKRQVRMAHKMEMQAYESTNKPAAHVFRQRALLLEALFGKELFNNEEKE